VRQRPYQISAAAGIARAAPTVSASARTKSVSARLSATRRRNRGKARGARRGRAQRPHRVSCGGIPPAQPGVPSPGRRAGPSLVNDRRRRSRAVSGATASRSGRVTSRHWQADRPCRVATSTHRKRPGPAPAVQVQVLHDQRRADADRPFERRRASTVPYPDDPVRGRIPPGASQGDLPTCKLRALLGTRRHVLLPHAVRDSRRGHGPTMPQQICDSLPRYQSKSPTCPDRPPGWAVAELRVVTLRQPRTVLPPGPTTPRRHTSGSMLLPLCR